MFNPASNNDLSTLKQACDKLFDNYYIFRKNDIHCGIKALVTKQFMLEKLFIVIEHDFIEIQIDIHDNNLRATWSINGDSHDKVIDKYMDYTEFAQLRKILLTQICNSEETILAENISKYEKYKTENVSVRNALDANKCLIRYSMRKCIFSILLIEDSNIETLIKELDEVNGEIASQVALYAFGIHHDYIFTDFTDNLAIMNTIEKIFDKNCHYYEFNFSSNGTLKDSKNYTKYNDIEQQPENIAAL